ncbi:MAG TPA: hypothetical protein VD887_07955 [Allosphingosinicella sp.]|nr:hypothetical protein [Allosphingosinicella sp.]
MLVPLLLAAALQGTPLPPAEIAFAETQARWIVCLEDEARRIAGAGRVTEATVDSAFPACRAAEEAVRASARASFDAAQAERQLAETRPRARRLLVARANPGSDPVSDATRALSRCIGHSLQGARADRGGRSDAAIVEAAFAACRAEQSAFRAAFAARHDPALADDALATFRAQTLDLAPRLLAPPPPR